LAAVGALLAGVSHELNNRLSVITGAADLALDADCPSEERCNLLQQLQTSAAACRRIAQDVLGVSHSADHGQLDCDIHDSLEAVIRLLERKFALEGVRIAPHFDRSRPQVMSNGHLLTQVLLNLFNNASDAMQESKRGGSLVVTPWL
jgi:two-component system NtrC family sensor kinase